MEKDGNKTEVDVAVLGCRGFIGSRVKSHLEEIGHVVFGGTSQNCNLLNPDQTREFLGAVGDGAWVVFASTINKAVDNSYAAMIKNIEMARNVIDAVIDGRLGGLIFCSSADVYGLNPECPINEKTPPCPANYYGMSKIACEHLLRMPGAVDCPVTVLRFPGVYGPGDKQGSIVGRFLMMLLEGATIPLRGGGKVLRDYVEVGDVCRLVERIIASRFDGVLNAATGVGLSIREVIEIISAEVNSRPEFEHLPEEENAAGDLVFDTSAIKSAFPDIRMKSLAEGVRRYAANVREDEAGQN